MDAWLLLRSSTLIEHLGPVVYVRMRWHPTQGVDRLSFAPRQALPLIFLTVFVAVSQQSPSGQTMEGASFSTVLAFKSAWMCPNVMVLFWKGYWWDHKFDRALWSSGVPSNFMASYTEC